LFLFEQTFLLLFLICRDQSGHLLTGCEGHVCQNVLLNLSPGHIRNIIGMTMSVVIIMSYALVLVPAREHIEYFVLR
jgi:hypothetical protein